LATISLLIGCRPRVAAITSSPRKLCLQRIQALAPELAIATQPFVQLAQWFGLNGIQPACAHRSYARKSVLSKDPKVRRDSRLRDSELILHHGAEHARGTLTIDEKLEDAAADGVPQHIERFHDHTVYSVVYISNR